MFDHDAQGGAAAYTSARGSWAWRAKSAYAATARTAGKALVAVKMLPSTPPPKERRIKHWLISLTKVHDSLAIAELGVPWWTYRAIDFVEAWLLARPKPVRAFEWGSGASTFWLADRVDEVYSVEHHEGFAEMMRSELAKLSKVTFLEVGAPHSFAPRVGSRKIGSTELDFHDYVHAIDTVQGDFDLVVVDGRAREACMRIAADRLSPGGLIIFDNSHRQRYKAAIASSGLHERSFGGLTPTLPYPDRTSVLSKASSSSG
ncbi:MAG: class I SAM-dependent methyltransferase [Actinomycetota bacterium]|nr:class I SAM-dependent methyltransferase [Actinomycetota bacterium]